MRREITTDNLFVFFIVGLFGLLWGVIPPLLWAAPSISSISGTVSDGQNITISGSGFGPNGPTVVLFDDFEGGTNGQQLQLNLAKIGRWTGLGTYNPGDAIYDNANKVSGSLSARFTCSPIEDQNSVIYKSGISVFNSFYVSYWAFIPAGDQWPGETVGMQNWKLVWIGWPDYDVACPVRVPQWAIAGNNWPSASTWEFSSSLAMAKGRWDRWQCWIKGREDNTGEIKLWNTQSGVSTKFESVSNLPTLKSGDSNKRSSVYMNAFTRRESNSHPTFDDFYFATGEYAQARVEIGNNATYSRCSNLTILTPALWSDTSIMATVRQGKFTNGSSAFLFVFDANGAVNTTGYPITIGGPPPPAAPTGLKIVN